MQELIDRQAALEIAMSYCQDDDGCCSKAGNDIREMLDEIESLPTIEPEVRHGRWVETEPDEDDRKIGIEFSIKCSICHDENSHLDFNENHEITGKTFWKSKFCPNCGADMGEEGADNG